MDLEAEFLQDGPALSGEREANVMSTFSGAGCSWGKDTGTDRLRGPCCSVPFETIDVDESFLEGEGTGGSGVEDCVFIFHDHDVLEPHSKAWRLQAAVFCEVIRVQVRCCSRVEVEGVTWFGGRW